MISEELLEQISPRAWSSLRQELQRTLEEVTRACLDLEWRSFLQALESLGFGSTSSAQSAERRFLGEKPSYRLDSLFGRFPVLPGLWSLAIGQWRNHVIEILERLKKDRTAISRCFFAQRPIGRIKDIRPGLSDPHDGGRTVTLLQFEKGRLIYKPRSGRNEATWFDLLSWMNRHGFAPKLRAARVLERRSYSWMEFAEGSSCSNEAAVRRFYQRLGGMIAAAYLLKAVDCHRENVVAAGEYPVLVDVDALWHVSAVTKTQTPATVLYRTGFFANSRRRSLQSRSSVLGFSRTGKHLARIDERPVAASDYADEIIRGFSRGWQCLAGTAHRRAALRKRLAQIRRRNRRWIYLATAKYAAIRRASLSPAALRSDAEREALLERHCFRAGVGRGVSQAEIRALRRLDLPYFLRKTNETMPPDRGPVPTELTSAIRNALRWTVGETARR